MPRRADTTESDDSLKENSGPKVNGSVKAEKSVKKEKERKKARVQDGEAEAEDAGEDEDGEYKEDERDVDGVDEDAEGEEDDEDEEDEDGAGSPKGRKRARMNKDGDGRPVKNELKGKGKERADLPRDDDGYIPGSIVRVQLQNFVTYDWVEFRPGPYLNMILGPNGTGKSSIACALCLGLNFPASLLGRANDLNSFVKLGTETGYIEIELKGKKGKGNLVVRRNLSAKSKSSTFTLNGQSATGKEVNMRMAELDIQVGNLCSFLPQDKVSEFARMSPQELLRQTQKAAGDENLTAWHDTLISSGKELNQVKESVSGERDQLKTMQERNAILEKDVERYNERRRIEKQIELLELVLPFMEYVEAKNRYHETKEVQRRLHDQVKKLKDRNAPAHALLAQLGEEHKEAGKNREKMKDASKAKFKAMKAKWGESEKLENEVQDVVNSLDGLKKKERERTRQIAETEQRIVKGKNELENPPEMEDLEALQQEIRELKAAQAKTRQKYIGLQERQKAHLEEEGRWKAKIHVAREQLGQLDDVNHQKLVNLSKWDRDCADTIVWLRQNTQRFRMEIIEPAYVSLNVPNKAYATAVEACFNANQLKCFVAQCPEDYKLLNQLVNDSTTALGRKGRINTWFRPRQDDSLVGPPLNEQEMAELNFDGYASQYVECPEGLKWFLMKELQMHRTAVALDGNRVNVGRAMELVSRFGPRGEGGGASFIAGHTMNSVSRSRYGRRLPQNQTREIRPARNLIQKSADPAVKQRLDSDIAESRQNLENLQGKAESLTKEDAELNAEHKEHEAKHEDLIARKSKVQDTQKRLQRMKIQIESLETRLERLRNEPSVEEERAKLKKKLLDNCRKRAKLARDYNELVRGAIKDQAEATRIGLQFLQIGANRTALDLLVKEHDAEYEKAYAEFSDADRLFQQAKADSKTKLDISKMKLDEVAEEVRAQFAEMENDGSAHEKSCEELQAELETSRAELSMNLNTNAGVIEQYERRKQEIETLSKTIEGREKRIDKIERAIKAAQDNWEPALEKLVGSIGEKFSAAFDRIGCAGEIRISRHEEFDKWAIDILVKFRDNEKLQLLTGQRQSGGERSLTTILYLMSLTEQARAPFSLVDEINQGMDQRAERAVHNELVEVTCKADSRQYFLITPKLLPNLRYDERMRVLCVNNGEWLPEERDLGNMMNMIDAFMQRRNRTNAAA